MAKALDRGDYFRKQDLIDIVLLLGGKVQEKDTLSNLHDTITIGTPFHSEPQAPAVTRSLRRAIQRKQPVQQALRTSLRRETTSIRKSC